MKAKIILLLAALLILLPSGAMATVSITNLQATQITTTSVAIAWNTDKSSDSTVYYATKQFYDSNHYYPDNKQNATETASHSITLTGLAANTQYQFQAYSYKTSTGESGSQTSTFITAAASSATAPQNFAARAGNGWVYLSWSYPASDGGAAIAYYGIYRGASSGAEVAYSNTCAPNPAACGPSGMKLFFNDTNVVNGQTYFYKASGWNFDGEGQLSNEQNATPSVPATTSSSTTSSSTTTTATATPSSTTSISSSTTSSSTTSSTTTSSTTATTEPSSSTTTTTIFIPPLPTLPKGSPSEFSVNETLEILKDVNEIIGSVRSEEDVKKILEIYQDSIKSFSEGDFAGALQKAKTAKAAALEIEKNNSKVLPADLLAQVDMLVSNLVILGAAFVVLVFVLPALWKKFRALLEQNENKENKTPKK